MSCKIIGRFRKTVWERLDYPIDWSRKLESGETIAASVWVVPAGLTEETSSYGATATSITLSGGSGLTTVVVSNRITTSEGRQYEAGLGFTICDTG